MQIVKLGYLTFGEKFRTFSPIGSIGNEYKVIGFIPKRGALCAYVRNQNEKRVMPLDRDVVVNDLYLHSIADITDIMDRRYQP